MAKSTLKTDWAPTLKDSIKAAGVPRGWSVMRMRQTTRLRVRSGAQGADGCWTKNLGIPWAINNIGKITETVAQLHQLTEAGQSLDQAWAEINPEEPDATELPGVVQAIFGIDWPEIQKRYLDDRQHNGTRVSAETIKLERPYLDQAVALLTGNKPPVTPYLLIDQTIRTGGWSDKARARVQCVDAVTRMLGFGMMACGLDTSWEIRQIEKAKLKASGAAKEDKEIADLSDERIRELLDFVHTDEWRNVLLVMAVYGLRPEEVVHLSVETNKTTGKRQLWCSYCKASGGRTRRVETKPRWLEPVPVRDGFGEPICGDLVAAMDSGLMPFPPLKEGGDAVGQYLNRQKLWKTWKAEFEAEGKWLRPYSFRNSYSVRAHAAGVVSAAIAEAMGHSEQTHSAHYLTSGKGTTTKAFEKAFNNN